MKTPLQFILCYFLLIPTLTYGQPICPTGWIHHDESCYLLRREKDNWFEAHIACTGHNSHLVTIGDQAENLFVKGLVMNAFSGESNANVWLGASDDVVEGHFTWYGTDAELDFTDWGPGEPNSVPLHIEEDCLVYWQAYSWKWADLGCRDMCYSVCEKSLDETPGIIG